MAKGNGNGLEKLNSACNDEAWDWLQETAPAYADAVQSAIKAGRSPDDIFYKALDKLGTHRRAFAIRLRNAAESLAVGDK